MIWRYLTFFYGFMGMSQVIPLTGSLMETGFSTIILNSIRKDYVTESVYRSMTVRVQVSCIALKDNKVVNNVLSYPTYQIYTSIRSNLVSCNEAY